MKTITHNLKTMIRDFFGRHDYSQYPDMKPRGVAKTFNSEDRDFNRDMEHLYTNIKKL